MARPKPLTHAYLDPQCSFWVMCNREEAEMWSQAGHQISLATQAKSQNELWIKREQMGRARLRTVNDEQVLLEQNEKLRNRVHWLERQADIQREQIDEWKRTPWKPGQLEPKGKK